MTDDKIELSVENARDLLAYINGDAGSVSVEEIEAALAAHEAAKNPLGLPWSMHPTVSNEVLDSEGAAITAGVATDAQAKLIAAAPEAFECLSELLGAWSKINLFDSEMRNAAESAHAILKKAGVGVVSEKELARLDVDILWDSGV